ncbi:MAG TPA: glycosyltransferase family 2 protein [Gemmatimonadales bacterium]|nr:glycosyltransferase family 2 protein [Gemmatimonadales bacterium]
MIYVCIPSYNEAPTVGLLLWKIRQTFTAFPREYQLLVVDDASDDATAEVLEPYARVLPLTVVRHAGRQGYAAAVQALLRLSLERSDRPKRDAAILMQGDFSHAPTTLPDLVRRLESGADVVVAQSTIEGEPSGARRAARRLAPWLLRGAVRVPGVSDLVSGFLAFRLVTLRNAFRAHDDRLVTLEGWAANAELIAKTARVARRVETVATVERHDLRQRPSRLVPREALLAVWHARRRLRPQPLPPPSSTAPPREERAAEVAS